MAERLTRDTDEEELAFLMVGRQIAGRQIPSVQQGEPLLEVRGLRLNLEGREVLHGIDLHVDAGEIVGIAGVSGNGQSQLISCITGLLPACAGQVAGEGEDVTNRPVRQIRDAGQPTSPRTATSGAAPPRPPGENTLMSRQDEAPFCKRGMMDYKRVRKHAVGLIRDFDVKASSRDKDAGIVRETPES